MAMMLDSESDDFSDSDYEEVNFENRERERERVMLLYVAYTVVTMVVKRRQWAEGVRPAEHVSDTCWFVKKPGWKNREKGGRKRRKKERTRKKERESSKRRGLVVLGNGEENPRFLFRDADQESKTLRRNNALRTGPRQAVE
ncbi:hypothetical protein TNCV_3012501 [Trichonephila clavipes]|nr:hypothetical protein TNCV_3012501 [Trichonephila clavipes]